MGDYGIKISLSGHDVTSSTPEQLAITSKYNSYKVKMGQSPAHFGIYEHTFSSNPGFGYTTLKTIAHGYSYTPSCFCLVKWYVDAYGGYRTNTLPAQHGIPNQLSAKTDATNFYIMLYRGDTTDDYTGKTWTFKYYIFVEDGD